MTATSVAPMAGPARRRPKPSGPTCRTSRANTGRRAVAPARARRNLRLRVPADAGDTDEGEEIKPGRRPIGGRWRQGDQESAEGGSDDRGRLPGEGVQGDSPRQQTAGDQHRAERRSRRAHEGAARPESGGQGQQEGEGRKAEDGGGDQDENRERLSEIAKAKNGLAIIAVRRLSGGQGQEEDRDEGGQTNHAHEEG